MVILKLVAEITPHKKKEFLQAMQSLVVAAPAEEGCLERVVYQRIDDEYSFCCLETWKSQQSLEAHLSTDHFKALLGAMQVLGELKEFSRNLSCPANGTTEEVKRNS